MKFLKSLITILLLNIFIFNNNLMVKATDNSGFKSGIYSLQNDIYHSSETGRSMARTYLNPNMKMEVRNGQVFFKIKFSGAQYMENFRMIVDGGGVAVNTIDRNTGEDTITLKFKGNSPKSKITAKIYVGPMERDVSFNIIPKLETANLIQTIEEPKPKKEIANKNIAEETYSKNKEDDKKSSNVNINEENKVKNNKTEHSENKEINREQLNKKESNKEEISNNSHKEEKKKTKEIKSEEVKSKDKTEQKDEVKSKDEVKTEDKTETTDFGTKEIKKENNPNENVIVEDEGKINVYEKINKQAIGISLVIGVVIIGGTILAIKKIKKKHK